MSICVSLKVMFMFFELLTTGSYTSFIFILLLTIKYSISVSKSWGLGSQRIERFEPGHWRARAFALWVLSILYAQSHYVSGMSMNGSSQSALPPGPLSDPGSVGVRGKMLRTACRISSFPLTSAQPKSASRTFQHFISVVCRVYCKQYRRCIVLYTVFLYLYFHKISKYRDLFRVPSKKNFYV